MATVLSVQIYNIPIKAEISIRQLCSNSCIITKKWLINLKKQIGVILPLTNISRYAIHYWQYSVISAKSLKYHDATSHWKRLLSAVGSTQGLSSFFKKKNDSLQTWSKCSLTTRLSCTIKQTFHLGKMIFVFDISWYTDKP